MGYAVIRQPRRPRGRSDVTAETFELARERFAEQWKRRHNYNIIYLLLFKRSRRYGRKITVNYILEPSCLAVVLIILLPQMCRARR